MKKFLLSLFVTICFSSFFTSSVSAKPNYISPNDSVIFDLSHTVITGNKISIPVYIVAVPTDTIHSFDFAMKFNIGLLTFDSISSLNYKLVPLAYYGSSDSTLRYTSSSTARLAVKTNQVYVVYSFKRLCDVKISDFYSITTLMNGLPCKNAFYGVIPNTHANVMFTTSPTCVNQQIDFQDLSTINGGSINSWSWDLGNGQTSTSPNPINQYATTGNYTIKLKVTSTSGCVDSIAHVMTINPLPSTHFTYTENCRTDSFAFKDASTISSGSVKRWNWYFGTSDTAASKNPIYHYATPGKYPVTLVAYSDSNCSTNYTDTVLGITTHANFGAKVGCLYNAVQFTDSSTTSSGPFLNWKWRFGNGNNAVTPHSASQLYNAAGTYPVTLVVNSALCTDSITKNITIAPLPQVYFSGTPIVACAPAKVSFTDSSITPNGSKYLWNYGDKSARAKTNSHTYTQPGTYSVTHIVTNPAGCVDSLVVPNLITVNAVPVANFSFHSSGCSGLSESFKDSSTVSSGSITKWLYNFSNGDTSTLPINTHTFNAYSNYSALLTVTTAQGCSDTISHTFNFPIPAKLAFGSDLNLGCPPLLVHFSDSTIEPLGTTFTWNFGDYSSNVVGTSTAHSFINSGVYQVKLVSKTYSGCLDSATRTITVAPLPTVNFSASSTVGCPPFSVTFKDSSITPVGSTLLWNFGDGSGNSAQPTHTFNQSGSFTVTHYVTSPLGCKDSLIIPSAILVNPLPNANFTDHFARCSGKTMDFADSSSIVSGSIANWNWSFGDGNKVNAAADTSHAYANYGNYKVKLVVTSQAGCSDSIIRTISLPTPAPLVFGSNLQAGCPPLSVQFTDSLTAQAGETFHWDFGDKKSSTSNNPGHTYNTTGIYSVKLTTINAGCKDSAQRLGYIQVYDSAVAQFPIVNGCFGNQVYFRDSSKVASGAITSWNWNFGDQSYSTQQNSTYRYNTAGTYKVTLKVTTNKGCVDSIQKTTIIQNIPKVKFAADEILGCTPLIVHFADSSTADLGSSYLWRFGDKSSTVSALDPAHIYSDSGTFTVSHIVTTTFGCTDSLVIKNYIKAVGSPIAKFIPSQDTVRFPTSTISFTNESSNFDWWQWNFGDSASSFHKTPIHTYVTPGSYNVCLQLKNGTGCAAMVCDTVVVLAPFAIAIPSAFTPNGDGKNDFLIVRGGPIVDFDFRIFDEWGKQVYQANTQLPGWDGTFNGTAQPTGTYIYTLSGETIDHQSINLKGVLNLIR